MTTALLNCKARTLLDDAKACAAVHHDKEVHPEHLLYVLVANSDELSDSSIDLTQLLSRRDITLDKLLEHDYWRQRNTRHLHGRPSRTPGFDQLKECDALRVVFKHARANLAVSYANPRHGLRPIDILIGIAMLSCSSAANIFATLGVDYVMLRTDVIQLREEQALAA